MLVQISEYRIRFVTTSFRVFLIQTLSLSRQCHFEYRIRVVEYLTRDHTGDH